jgi:hydroxylaminobenzene mutase
MRMGLAAHLEGVMNVTFLLALGAAWPSVRLPPAGTYMNWVVTTLAAIFATAALSPITGPGHPAQPWQETLVTIGFQTVGIAIVASSALILWGLRRPTSPMRQLGG